MPPEASGGPDHCVGSNLFVLPGEEACLEQKREDKRAKMDAKPSLVSYRPLYVSAYEVFQRDALNELLTLNPKKHLDVLTNATKTKTECFGDRRLKRFANTLICIPGGEIDYAKGFS